MKYALVILRVFLVLVVLAISLIVWKDYRKTELELVAPYGQGVAVVAWDVHDLDESYWSGVHDLCSLSVAGGKSFYMLTDSLLNMNLGTEVMAERDVLKELMPSNGGVLVYSDGIISDRFPHNKMLSDKMVEAVSSDTDFVVADNSALERVFLTGLFVLVLLIIMIIHHIIRRRKLAK